MSANLTWGEASALAREGMPIRRAAWTKWLTVGLVLWQIEDAISKRIVEAEDFTAPEFLARDWTTDPIADVDVCSRPPAALPPFVAPALTATITPASDFSTVAIRADINFGSEGNYRLSAWINGQRVALVEGALATMTINITPAMPAAPTVAVIEVVAESILPLPAWRETSRARYVVPLDIEMAAYFPVAYLPSPYGVPTPYGADLVFGPFGVNARVFSPASDPVSVDDDIAINGVVIEPGVYVYALGVNGSHTVGHGADFDLLTLPAGETFTLNVMSNFPYSTSAIGVVRLMPI